MIIICEKQMPEG